MAIRYKTCSDTGTAAAHVCDACNGTEKARVRSIFFIRPGTKMPETVTDTGLTPLIESGEVIIIPNTTGSIEDSVKEGDGYGDETGRILGHDYTAQVKDPSYKDNLEFYEGLECERWGIGYRTESLLHIFPDVRATVSATQPVEESLDSEVVWNIQARWFSKGKGRLVSVDDGLRRLFDCYEVTQAKSSLEQ